MAARPILRRGSTDVEQVKQLQRMLNRVVIPSPQLGVLGNFKERTEAAVKAFQVASGLYPDGVVGPKTWAALGRSPVLAPGTTTLPPPTPPPTGNPSTDASWIEVARGELKLKGNLPNVEKKGHEQNNPRILEYIATYPYLKDIDVTRKVAKLDEKGQQVKDAEGKTVMVSEVVTDKDGKAIKMGNVDETAWCACFVNWCLKQVGKSTKKTSAMAKSWAEYGVRLAEPKFGAVVVIYKKPTKKTASTTTSGYHVAFYISGTTKPGETGDVVILGGNQGNAVSETTFKGWQVVAYRWPV